MQKYDLTIAFRIFPGISKQPLFYPTDKLKMSELGVASLKNACEGLKVKMLAILDGCPPEYEELFKKYFNAEDLEIIHVDKLGNLATFKLQIEKLLEQTYSDIVYFAEDDYLYRDGTFIDIVNFFKSNKDVQFITPYDHLDYYTLDFHNYKSEVRQLGKHHWRSVSTTCLTFFTTKEHLKNTRHVFESYFDGNKDASLWLNLTKIKSFCPFTILKAFLSDKFIFSIYLRAWFHGWKDFLFKPKYKLWSPVPSIATHLESTGIAPGVDWQKEADKFKI